jgi:site-specific DNA recombinase
VPLGYESRDKKLIVNAAEAGTVRLIFARYLAVKSFQKLVEELNNEGIVTKARGVAGKTVGGISFTYGPLAYLLKNRTYLGETGHDGHWFHGEHKPIIEREVFEQVQCLLKANSEGRTGKRHEGDALLTGFLYDDRGNRMSPSFTTKGGARYRFYVSSALLRGRKAQAGSVTRVSATEIEAKVLTALQTHLTDGDQIGLAPRDVIESNLERVVVDAKHILITLKSTGDPKPVRIVLPWSAPTKHNQVSIDEGNTTHHPRSADRQLVNAIVRAPAWLRLLIDGTYDSIESLAHAINLHPKIIRKRIQLAFLAPQIVGAVLRGEQPASLNLTDLNRVCLLSWSRQSRIEAGG